jgi:hypothetical protein
MSNIVFDTNFGTGNGNTNGQTHDYCKIFIYEDGSVKIFRETWSDNNCQKYLYLVKEIIDNIPIPKIYLNIILKATKLFGAVYSGFLNYDEIYNFLKNIKDAIKEEYELNKTMSTKLYNCEKYFEDYKLSISDALLQKDKEIKKYNKIEEHIKKVAPHLSKYFDSDINELINNEEEQQKHQKNYAEQISKSILDEYRKKNLNLSEEIFF